VTRKISQEKNASANLSDAVLGLATPIKRQLVELFEAELDRMRCCNCCPLAFTINAAMNFRRCLTLLAVVLSIAFLFGCGHKRHGPATARSPRPRPQAPKAIPVGTVEEGIASWYGVPYHGRPAADGEIYNMEKLVAAHRTMPFNTWLKVTNLQNGLSVDVRVIDRGPFVANRIIDLSKAAARQIQMLGPGIARVRIEVVSAPADFPSNDFYAVQVGAFANYANASRARARYAARYGTAQIAIKQGRVPLYRVLVGREPSPQAAQQLAAQLRTGSAELFIVRLDSQTQGTAPPAEADVSAPGSSN
jgi:rare lipoprotein A